MQENNHIVIVDLEAGAVLRHFSAGEVTIRGVDATEDGRISLTETITRRREPDGTHWIGDDRIVTANEGDLFGGSRGFTIFDRQGAVRFDSGSAFEELAVSHGHYPESRSDAKGAEPEGIEHGRYGSTDYLFVGSERGSFIGVYRLQGTRAPQFVQVLPAGSGPEGLLAIPGRDLLVATSENDDPPFGLRTIISIYRLERGPASYPQLVSAQEPTGTPIAWSAMSGLAGDPERASRVYAIWDAFFSADPRIFTIDVSTRPAVIDGYHAISGAEATLDLEGIAVVGDGTFWVASEGNGDDSIPNLLVHVAADGSVIDEVGLPGEILDCRAASTAEATLGSGFEGVAIGRDGLLYVAQQRGWDFTTPECEDLDDDHTGLNPLGEPLHTRIWVFDPGAGTWDWTAYELEEVPENASWVGLSEITALPDGTFALIERDNRTGTFSGIKSLVRVDVEAVEVITRTDKAITDVRPQLEAGNGWMLDKPEGFAVAANGSTYLVTDNDGVDGSTGETQFLRLGRWGRLFPS